MARTSRKKAAEAPKINIGAEIFASLRELEKMKGIPVDTMAEKLKDGLKKAYSKDCEGHRSVPAENVVVDLTEEGLSMHVLKTAVEEVTDVALEIQMEAAKNYMPNVQPGDVVSIPVEIEKFGRIAAQTAKQQVIQTIRTAEREAAAENNGGKVQELLTGTVIRLEPNGDVFVQIGQGAAATRAVLRADEQIPGETYREGQLVRVYVLENRRMGMRSSLMQVSRTHPNVVRRLFELETPEIASGEVEIRNIAREPGSRSKMAVRATAPDVDPVGACVGPRGGRVGAVVEELHGEKIDIVVWSEDPCEYVKAALSPATVLKAELVPGTKVCRVVVPDDELSLAIGKEGQNARLAARLTGYKVDIKSASKAQEVSGAE